MRDNARNEANKLLLQYREKREQIDQHLSRIESLNTAINAAEQDMVAMKRHYEAAVRDRNQTGTHLLDRNDELCILYEKLNVQEMVLKRGEAELADREEEIRKLRLTVQEYDRVIELQKKLRPVVAEYDKEVEALQKEYDETAEKVIQLSREIESPNDPSRLKNLPGTDPSQKELTEKLKHLEERLAEKEERLLEKDLILEEVSTLTNRLKKQTLSNRQESAHSTILATE
ncbi:MAG: hypothetical protein BJ554DRAFT_6702 [Olpidium bornovanus]|uniref:Cilia- and flagella-associated protein 58 central coiled coil domain-containing protein n=1 Tax=Olpidium bornovanus TaxID=278681 RepID=A0A8H8DK03_9FUNG|nr:MAG: hypothetical protein BJ554DRAFT_6702 [Olpidium bornovanus]